MFVAPGQTIHVNINTDYKPQGYALLFHPDLIHGTDLGKHMDDYTFFSYQSREALHLSEKERKIVLDCLARIKYELEQGTDKHSKKLIAANIELFIDYCLRFYNRQFISRSDVNNTIPCKSLRHSYMNISTLMNRKKVAYLQVVIVPNTT